MKVGQPPQAGLHALRAEIKTPLRKTRRVEVLEHEDPLAILLHRGQAGRHPAPHLAAGRKVSIPGHLHVIGAQLALVRAAGIPASGVAMGGRRTHMLDDHVVVVRALQLGLEQLTVAAPQSLQVGAAPDGTSLGQLLEALNH